MASVKYKRLAICSFINCYAWIYVTAQCAVALIKYGKSFQAQGYFCKSCKVSFGLIITTMPVKKATKN